MSEPMPREASGFMNYPNDCTKSFSERIASGAPMGPNDMGEYMWPVSAEYDAAVNRTRVGFTLVPPDQEAKS